MPTTLISRLRSLMSASQGRRGSIVVLAVCAALSIPSQAFAQPKPNPAQHQVFQLKSQTTVALKCNLALEKLPRKKEVDNVLADLNMKVGMLHGKLNAPAMLQALQRAAGAPIGIDANDLTQCVKIYKTELALKAKQHPMRGMLGSTDGGYPDCDGGVSCPNPTEYGGQCCTSSQVCASSCSDEGSECSAYCESKCFPADAKVQLENGSVKQMRDVVVGDRVQVIKHDGSVGYDDVYMFTHRDPSVVSSYYRVKLDSGQVLTLSPRHFLPVSRGNESWSSRVLIGANELAVGDRLWNRDGTGNLAIATVAAVDTLSMAGAYNPQTGAGTIVVNGAVASVHSDWFLDGIVSAEVQGSVYQAIFAPVRGIYALIGPSGVRYITEDLGVVDFVRDHGIAASVILASLLFVLAIALQRVWRLLRNGILRNFGRRSLALLARVGRFEVRHTPAHERR